MKMINLGSLHDDPYSGAWSINDRGQVVGFSFDGDEKFQAVLWDRHGMHPLDTLGGSFTYANAVNRYGEIAGQATFPDESYYESGHAVLWNKQGITDITPFDSDWSTASSINKDGVAVGAYFNADGLWHAVLWDENGVYPMETLGGDQSVAYWINDKGEAVGGCVLPESHRWHACLWDVNGFPWDLSTPEGPDSEAYSINDRGQVVGLYYPDGGPRAFLWSRNHGMLDLTALADLPDGVVLTTAFSINDFGWITGMSSLGTAYLLIPYWPFTR
jgi:probable HAF family extracellular repeat protein